MKKLLIGVAAAAFSTSFAFASTTYHPVSIPTFSLTTGNNWPKITNTVTDVTVINAVNQNSGLQVPITVITPVGPDQGGMQQ